MTNNKNEFKKELSTMSGMWALWDFNSYSDIDCFEKWKPLFCEDEEIEKQIVNKTFVPLYVHENNTRAFTVKINGELNEREQKYAFMSSDKYIFHCSGKAVLSGIDYIASELCDDTLAFELEEGDYSVQVYLVAWDKEPNAILENGEVSPDALTDFVVLISSETDYDYPYRTKVNTFKEYE